MEATQTLKGKLMELLQILGLENEALISNDTYSLRELVEEKVRMIQELETFSKNPPNRDPESAMLALEIRELQETNLFLTKQAMVFQENLLANLMHCLEGTPQTYSQKGGYPTKEQGARLIDQKG